MIRKRSRFWTVAFSMLPGAGHMYNGFMKLGVSLMALFFAVLFVSSALGLGPVMLLIPVIWFYAFFDCINKRFQDDEEFYAQEDYYLFEMDKLRSFDFGFFGRRKLIVGIVLIGFGVYILWQNTIVYLLYRLDLPEVVINTIMAFTDVIPQVAISILIIWAGISLIRGKKIEVGHSENLPADKPSDSAGQPPVAMEQPSTLPIEEIIADEEIVADEGTNEMEVDDNEQKS